MFDFPKTTGEILASWQQPTWVIPKWALSPKKHDPRKNMRANKAFTRQGRAHVKINKRYIRPCG